MEWIHDLERRAARKRRPWLTHPLEMARHWPRRRWQARVLRLQYRHWKSKHRRSGLNHWQSSGRRGGHNIIWHLNGPKNHTQIERLWLWSFPINSHRGTKLSDDSPWRCDPIQEDFDEIIETEKEESDDRLAESSVGAVSDQRTTGRLPVGYLLVGLHQLSPPYHGLETLPEAQSLLGHISDSEERLTQLQFKEDVTCLPRRVQLFPQDVDLSDWVRWSLGVLPEKDIVKISKGQRRWNGRRWPSSDAHLQAGGWYLGPWHLHRQKFRVDVEADRSVFRKERARTGRPYETSSHATLRARTDCNQQTEGWSKQEWTGKSGCSPA